MKNVLFIALLMATSFFSCEQKKAEQPTTHSDSVTETIKLPEDNSIAVEEPGSDSTYAYVRKIYQKGDSSYIDADYIQFLTGKAAIDAAKKNHDADTFYGDNGKIIEIGVPDDYYIVNQSKQIRTLPLAKDADIETMDMSSGNVLTKKMSVKDFKARGLKNGLPFILKLRNNEVTAISEVYLP